MDDVDVTCRFYSILQYPDVYECLKHSIMCAFNSISQGPEQRGDISGIRGGLPRLSSFTPSGTGQKSIPFLVSDFRKQDFRGFRKLPSLFRALIYYIYIVRHSYNNHYHYYKYKKLQVNTIFYFLIITAVNEINWLYTKLKFISITAIKSRNE